MKNFESKKKSATPAVSPEAEEFQHLLAGIKKNESAFFSDHSLREGMSGKLEEAAKKLADHDPVFKEILVEVFRDYVEKSLGSHSGERWMDRVFIDTFTKYQGEQH